jgi:hypothetical protein
MTYTFKLSRRLARLRAAAVVAVSVATLSCAEDGLNEPGSVSSSTDPTRVLISPDSAAMSPHQSLQFEAASDSTATAIELSASKGGNGRGRGKLAIADVSVTPQSLQVGEGATASFTATATLRDGSTSDPRVTWSAIGGTIDGSGLYTAGATPGNYHVVAVATNGVADTAAVVVTETAPTVAAVTLSPTAAALPVGGSQRFTAVGKAADGTTVAIGLQYAATGGSMSPEGVYQAGRTAGTFRVIAKDTSSGKADTSAVTITVAAPTLTRVLLRPATVSLDTGATRQFGVLDSLSDGTTKPFAGAYSATGGTISAAGLFKAGPSAGTFRVIASEGSLADTSTVTIIAPAPAPAPAPSPPPSSPTDPCAGLTVCAGPDVAGAAGTAIPLAGIAPAGQKVFWTKMSGPGEAVFTHEMFNASFEDGTVSEWAGDGGGEQTPTTKAFVSADHAHSGLRGWVAYNDPNLPDPYDYSAKLLRWRFDQTEGYYSAWYYWPSSYPVNTADNYVNIFQFKQDGAPFDPTWIVAAKNFSGVDRLAIHDYFGANITPTGFAIPKDTWFNITAYLKASNTTGGRFIVWINHQVVFDRSGLNTIHGPMSTLMWGVGNYGKAGMGTNHELYVDDTAVANATLDARSTSARFSRPGTYTLRLTAYDGTRTISDDVLVSVQ